MATAPMEKARVDYNVSNTSGEEVEADIQLHVNSLNMQKKLLGHNPSYKGENVQVLLRSYCPIYTSQPASNHLV